LTSEALGFRVELRVYSRHLVERGVRTNTGYCPETSRDANGYNRLSRIKALPNVAE
jgi:hypothetical protein